MQLIVKRIISHRFYDKYFKNCRIIYKGSEIGNVNSFFHYAYVSFVTGNKYFGLINGSIFSVHYFSTYPVILYVAGNISDYNYNLFKYYNRLLVVAIEKEKNNIYFMKLRVSLLAPVLVGQIVESDTIVLPAADCLFKRIEKEITKKYPFPMMTRHHDIRAMRKGKGTFNTLDYPMENRTMRYMHAHMSWTYYSLPYIAKIYMKSHALKYKDDEYALNVNLWESKANKQWCTYDPLYSVVDLSHNSNIFKKKFKSITFFNFIHGCKSQLTLNLLLLKLKKIKIEDYKIIYSINNSIYFSQSCKIDQNIIAYTNFENCLI